MTREIRVGTFKGLPKQWSYGFSWTFDNLRGQGKVINVWLFRLIKMPERGERIQRKVNYNGFNLSFGYLIRFYIN